MAWRPTAGASSPSALYVAHLSTVEAADLVAAARARGEAVWAEVTPHHLTHTGDMEREIGCWGKVNPPLRAVGDTERLWRAFHDGGNTARVFGLYPRKGVLAPGADADVVIVDPDLEATVDDAFYHCLCEVSIYRGQKFRGLAWTTIVRGRVMMEARQTVGAPGWGRYVPRGATST